MKGPKFTGEITVERANEKIRIEGEGREFSV